MIRYVPYGFVLGIVLFLAVLWIDKRRQKKGLKPGRRLATVCFFTYVGILIMITYLSRESGGTSRMDWQIGSTLRINARNDAFLFENILLFIPYGFCFAWYRAWKPVFWKCTGWGFVTSLFIEVVQLVTKRGVFQIDDILTNTLGCILGGILFGFFRWCFRK